MTMLSTLIGRHPRLGAALALTQMLIFLPSAWAQNLPVYTSPIDITGGRLSVSAFAPDRDTGALTSRPLPPGAFGPRMTALTSTPINMLMDARWNGTPAQIAAGTSPRQQACDGPSGVKTQIGRQMAATGSTPYNVSCNFGTTGQVFVKQVGPALYLSYQIFNNSVKFRATSPVTCQPGHGTPFCPNDPNFEVRFAIEMLTLVWTPSLCAIRAESPNVHLHGVQIESQNVTAGLVMFYDAAFKDNRFLAAELALQATETRAPITIDDAFDELRSSPACAGNDDTAKVLRTFTQLETIIAMPQGIELRATHPAIPAPRIQNVSLPYGPDTCAQGFVWREAYPGDHVCVTPQTRTQAASDNAQANARRSPNGGPYGPATCRAGFVWREAGVGDLVCVPPEVRARTAADNAAAASRRVLQPASIPSFTRPSITAPPVVSAGASFQVSGQFFPPTLDPTTIQLFIDRDGNAACFGGATELESARVGAAPVAMLLPATPASMSSCNYRYAVKGLQTATPYRFRIRDCDAVTCSPWSSPFQTMTGTLATTPIQLTLDSGVGLGTATTDASGTFQVHVTMPASTTTGPHKITAASGLASDSTSVQVTGGRSAANILVTGAFYGDRGCPMRTAPNVIAAAESFTLFGSGFQPGAVNIRLDTLGGRDLGSATAQADGTFCAYFNGPPFSDTGAHRLVAIQSGSVRASLAVTVVINRPIH